MSDHPPLRSYGRTKARALKPRQAGLLDTLLPHLAVPEDGSLDLDALFPDFPVATAVLEIGFGGGEHLVVQAGANPGVPFIGVEPFMNGVASCLRHIEESGVTNVRIHHGDARDVIARLPDASLGRVDILFPDPWPKKRHWKRRLIQPEFVAELSRVLNVGGEVRFATDWANYAAWTLALFIRNPSFSWSAERAADWRAAWRGHAATRYELKRLGDCAPVFLQFVRCNT